MRKETFYMAAIIFMVISNLLMVGVVFLRTGGSRKETKIGEKIMSELQLSKDQEMLYRGLIQDHRKKIDSLEQVNRLYMRAYFALLRQAEPDTAIVHAAEERLSVAHSQKAMLTYKHFREFQQLLTPEQSKKFNELLPDILVPDNRPAE